MWNKSPRLDVALSQVSRKTDLAFEDMRVLADPMDKRMDSLLKKTLDSSLGNLRPATAVKVVARNMEYWLTQIKAHIKAGTPKEKILSSFPMLLRGVAYIADASAESVSMSARSSVLANLARRALWLKTWQGVNVSKVNICGIPLTGDLLFGPDLKAVLDRMANRTKAFPIKESLGNGLREGLTHRRGWWPRGMRGRKRFGGTRAREAIIFPPEQPQRAQ